MRPFAPSIQGHRRTSTPRFRREPPGRLRRAGGRTAIRKLNLFEGFAEKIVEAVKANKELWAQTAIFITFDEGGGYYDSGYVQRVDRFGDGTRIPMIVVSPYSTGGHIAHSYTDHVSTLKFIEAMGFEADYQS